MITEGSAPSRKGVKRRKAPAGAAEKAVGCAVLAALCAISIYLYVQQARFSPAVIASLNSAPQAGRLPGEPDGPSSGTAAMLPGGLAGLSPLSAAASFSPETLSDKIDGKAELYLSSGFREMACRSFGNAEARIEVYVYEMESPDGAFAVFSGQRRSGSEPSDLARNAYFTENALFFASGNYYVEAVADRADESVKQSLQAVGKALLAALPAEADTAGPTTLFPPGGLDRDSVRLTASDSFGLEGFNDVYTGEYKPESGEATAFLSVRPTPEDASAWREKYLTFLKENGYSDVEAQEAPAGAAVLRLDDSFEVVLTEGRILAGVHEATSLPAALDLARQLASELQGKKK